MKEFTRQKRIMEYRIRWRKRKFISGAKDILAQKVCAIRFFRGGKKGAKRITVRGRLREL